MKIKGIIYLFVLIITFGIVSAAIYLPSATCLIVNNSIFGSFAGGSGMSYVYVQNKSTGPCPANQYVYDFEQDGDLLCRPDLTGGSGGGGHIGVSPLYNDSTYMYFNGTHFDLGNGNWSADSVNYYDASTMDTMLTNYYTSGEMDTMLLSYYQTGSVDMILDEMRVNISGILPQVAVDYYNKTQINSALNNINVNISKSGNITSNLTNGAWCFYVNGKINCTKMPPVNSLTDGKYCKAANVEDDGYLTNYESIKCIYDLPGGYSDSWINLSFYNQTYINNNYYTQNQINNNSIIRSNNLTWCNATGLILNWSNIIGTGVGNNSFNQTLTSTLYYLLTNPDGFYNVSSLNTYQLVYNSSAGYCDGPPAHLECIDHTYGDCLALGCTWYTNGLGVNLSYKPANATNCDTLNGLTASQISSGSDNTSFNQTLTNSLYASHADVTNNVTNRSNWDAVWQAWQVNSSRWNNASDNIGGTGSFTNGTDITLGLLYPHSRGLSLQNLRGYWPLDNNKSSDISGNGYDFTSINASYSYIGKLGNALNLSKPTSILSNANILLEPNQGTLSFWLYVNMPRDDAEGNYLFNCGSGNYYIYQDTMGANLWVGAISEQMYGGGSQITFSLKNSSWNNLVFTWDNTTGTTSIYVNGGLVYSMGYSGTKTCTGLQIGNVLNQQYAFYGVYDEIAYFNESFDSEQVKYLFEKNVELIYDWGKFDVSSGGNNSFNQSLTDSLYYSSSNPDGYFTSSSLNTHELLYNSSGGYCDGPPSYSECPGNDHNTCIALGCTWYTNGLGMNLSYKPANATNCDTLNGLTASQISSGSDNTSFNQSLTDRLYASNSDVTQNVSGLASNSDVTQNISGLASNNDVTQNASDIQSKVNTNLTSSYWNISQIQSYFWNKTEITSYTTNNNSNIDLKILGNISTIKSINQTQYNNSEFYWNGQLNMNKTVFNYSQWQQVYNDYITNQSVWNNISSASSSTDTWSQNYTSYWNISQVLLEINNNATWLYGLLNNNITQVITWMTNNNTNFAWNVDVTNNITYDFSLQSNNYTNIDTKATNNYSRYFNSTQVITEINNNITQGITWLSNNLTLYPLHVDITNNISNIINNGTFVKASNLTNINTVNLTVNAPLLATNITVGSGITINSGINMTGLNVTQISCLVFTNGGKICTGNN